MKTYVFVAFVIFLLVYLLWKKRINSPHPEYDYYLPHYNFYNFHIRKYKCVLVYRPVRCRTRRSHFLTAEIVYAFKRGEFPIEIMRVLSDFVLSLRKRYGSDIYIIPIPASSKKLTRDRWFLTVYALCTMTDTQPGDDFYSLTGDVVPFHLSHVHTDITSRIVFHDVLHRRFIILDDVITTGRTSYMFERELKRNGGIVIGRIFAAGTHGG